MAMYCYLLGVEQGTKILGKEVLLATASSNALRSLSVFFLDSKPDAIVSRVGVI